MKTKFRITCNGFNKMFKNIQKCCIVRTKNYFFNDEVEVETLISFQVAKNVTMNFENKN